MKKMNIFKIFLIFFTFFNCLFFSMEVAFSVTQKTVIGPRDRVRKFNDLNFKYIAPMNDGSNLGESGFYCKPDGLKYMEFKESGIGEAFDEGIGATYYVIANLLLFPLLCSQILNIYNLLNDSETGFRTFMILLASTFGFKSLEYLENLIFDEDDFNLDPYNEDCLAVGVSMLAICLTILLITKIKSIRLGVKIIIIVGLDVAMNAIKEVFKGVQYSVANAVFNDFELCGDNWLTYGNEMLESKIDGLSIIPNAGDTWNTWNKYISEFYPSKGAFNGSYKYKINKCFIEGNIDYCRLIYNDKSLTFESISDISNFLYKPYREFYYDGMEFSYSGCNDPREDRGSYIDTSDKTSQLYYFRGNDAANFACDRFLTSSSDAYREAYKCCLEASQRLVCINYNSVNKKQHVMCNKDDDSSCQLGYNTSLVKFSSEDYEKQTKNSLNNDYCKELKKMTVEKFCAGSDSDKNSENCKGAESSYNEICDKNGKIKINLKANSSEDSENNDKVISIIDRTIKFKIRQSTSGSSKNKYCVETYNLCPYNFRILGGTEQYGNEFSMSNESDFEVENVDGIYQQKDSNESYKKFNKSNNCSFDADGNRHCNGPCFTDNTAYACYNKPSNFCQIDRHCVFVQPLEETESVSLSPYIDKACLDGIGSSHNFLNYETPLIRSSIRNKRLLVAPIVECTVETFKNILLNKAGHSICKNLNDTVVEDVCLNSETVIKAGDDLSKSGYESPFIRIQIYIKNILKALLVLSVILYGYNIVLFRKGSTPEEIIKYILTLILVSYLSFDSHWINDLFSNVYNVYNKVSELAVNILAQDKESYNYDNPKYGGCFFFKALYINNKYDNYKDRKYLAVFDTFDCKLSRYFGYYSNNIANPPIISIFIMGIFTAGLSILTMLPFLLLFVSLIFFAVRIAYIFIVNSITITILLFMTPIFLPMILFERTKGYFQSWLKKILQNVMSPLFILMSFSLFLVIFDKYYTADAVFYGENEPIRSVYCNNICKITDTNYFNIDPKNETQKTSCNESKGKIIDLKKNAPICATQDQGVSNKTGVSFIDFLIEDFPGLPGLGGYSGVTNQIEAFFNMFFDLIFLLILIFIFEQFVSYVNSMTGVIFSPDGTGGQGIDSNASGLPSLQNITQAVGSSGAQTANKSFDILRNTPGIINDKRNRRNDNK